MAKDHVREIYENQPVFLQVAVKLEDWLKWRDFISGMNPEIRMTATMTLATEEGETFYMEFAPA